MQLVAYGAPDVYLTGNTSDAHPSNMRDSMASRWFVARDDGLATRSDLPAYFRDPAVDFSEGSILAHAPASMAPPKDSHRWFSVREERLADPPTTTFADYAELFAAACTRAT